MRYDQRWEKLDELGAGGQGTVYRAHPISFGPLADAHVWEAIVQLATHKTISDDHRARQIKTLQEYLPNIFNRDNPQYQCALKVLHPFEQARDAESANERIRREIDAMSRCSHPNLLKIVDHDREDKWYASKFYVKGSLDKHLELFNGHVEKSLAAFRPLVEAVAYLHQNNMVHRDIKPQNIFVDDDGQLILGDFGLVYFEDDQKTRLSNTFSNVGSRDWMPIWAQGVRVDEISPTFDVFSLGKILWSMISGLPVLTAWYFNDTDYPDLNVLNRFSKRKYIELVNPLLERCVVERERDCLPNALALLKEVDHVIDSIQRNPHPTPFETVRLCIVCGVGEYQRVEGRSLDEMRNFGLDPAGAGRFLVYSCPHCGHTQLFYSGRGQPPPAWNA